MNLFTLVATLGLDTSEFDKKIGSAVDQGKKAGSGLAKAASFVGKSTAAIAIAAATAYVAIVHKAVDSVAELEQNVGGAIAVWGEGLGEQQRRIAMQAAENVGLSTSQYLETSNRMGSLLQGMGFDTREAFALSTQAIQRTADVASIMNIPIENAMEAINGLAKGNFTMMDNLGVAMNETALANYALEQGIKKSTSKMSQQEKIALALQMYMDKTAHATGNFAKEAEGLAGATTILKATWANFLDGTSDPEQMADALTNYLVSHGKVIGEVAPRIAKTLWATAENLYSRAKTWVEETGGLFESWKYIANWELGQMGLPDLDTIVEQVKAWWNGQEGDNAYEKIKSVVKWAFGDVILPRVEDFILSFSVWWNGEALPAIKSVAKWVWGELITPMWEDISTTVSTWWEGITAKLAETLNFEWPGENFDFPTWDDIKTKAEAFWNSVKQALASLFHINIGVGFNLPGGGEPQHDGGGADYTIPGVAPYSGETDFSRYRIPNTSGGVSNVTINMNSVAMSPSDVGAALGRAMAVQRFY